MAWARHGVCEIAFKVWKKTTKTPIKENQPLGKDLNSENLNSSSVLDHHNRASAKLAQQ
jgi:hypothetical protein